MATVKKANVPPTHPTVWVGLALAVVGLLVAMYAYTGTRVYEVAFAFVALAGAVLALAGILTAAWGRSIMAARASRSRRGLMQEDALKLAVQREAPQAMAEVVGAENVPTVAAPSEKRRFSFSLPKRKEKEASSAAVLSAFRRRPASDDPRDPDVARTLAPAETVEVAIVPQPAPAAEPTPAVPERLTMRCPECGATFAAEGVRPFAATCPQCGFSATV